MKFCNHTQSWIIPQNTVCFLSYCPVQMIKETVGLWKIVVLNVHVHDVQKKGLKQSLTSLKLVLLPSKITILERLKVLYKVTIEHDVHFRADMEKCWISTEHYQPPLECHLQPLVSLSFFLHNNGWLALYHSYTYQTVSLGFQDCHLTCHFQLHLFVNSGLHIPAKSIFFNLKILKHTRKIKIVKLRSHFMSHRCGNNVEVCMSLIISCGIKQAIGHH